MIRLYPNGVAESTVVPVSSII